MGCIESHDLYPLHCIWAMIKFFACTVLFIHMQLLGLQSYHLRVMREMKYVCKFCVLLPHKGHSF